MRKARSWQAIASGLALAFFAASAYAQAPEIRFARQFSMGYLQFNLMERHKLLEKHAKAAGIPDVKVVWATFNSPAAMNDALLSNSIDIVSGGVPGLLTIWARTQGTPNAVKGIAAFSSQPILLNTRNPNVKTIADFTDQDKIAVPAVKVSVQAMMLQMAAAKQWGEGSYAKLDPLTVGMSPPDATVALLSELAGITSVFSVPPFQYQQLEKSGVHTVLNSYDVFGGPHTFTVAWTSSQFRDKNPALYKALIAAFEEATATLNKDVKEASQYWIDDVKSKLALDQVAAIASGKQVKWTMVPESTVKYAEFMYAVGSIKVKPSTWKDLFFPEVQHLPGAESTRRSGPHGGHAPKSTVLRSGVVPPRLKAAINIEDLRRLAKRRLPKIAFDFIEGGVEDEDGLARNEQAFRRFRLVPRYLVDVTKRDQSTTLFGRTYSSPIGVAPTGLASLFRYGADCMLAEAAKAANIPFIVSGTGTGRIEELARLAPDHIWYQLYVARDRRISEDMVRRASDAGISTLVLTVDVPVNSKRERNLRNGFLRPLKLTWKTKLEACLHPGWVFEYLRHGMPLFANWQPYAPAGSTVGGIADFVAEQTPVPVLWQDVETFRRLWTGPLVIKGIMHPDDAKRCATAGVDGIIVSNHGGRQLDRAPAPLEMLGAIGAAVDHKLVVMMDSGVRRGSDVIIALCMGAKFVFVGRPVLYGAAAGGRAGAVRALEILMDEIDRTMAQMGATDLGGCEARSLLRNDADGRGRVPHS